VSRLSWIQKLDYYVDESNSSKLDAVVDIEVARNILNFQPDFHRKALVYGTKFYSRGVKQNYREYMIAKLIHHQIVKHGNGLKKRTIIDLAANSSVPALRLVTACSMPFFSVSAIDDKVLTNLLVVSMTSFDFETTPICKVETVDREDSLVQIYFVALHEIYPTQIGTIPFTVDGLATIISNTGVDGTMRKYVKSRFDDSRIKPHHNVMILLHPDKLSLQPTIE
jgi:hypothetical protein